MGYKIQIFYFLFFANCILAKDKIKDKEKKKHRLKNFIVMRVGGGITGIMNDFTFNKHDKYNKYLDNIPILNQFVSLIRGNSNFHYKKIINDIKEHGFSYLLSNLNISCDILYNRFLIGSTYFSFGISFRYTNKLITDSYLKNLKIYLDEYILPKDFDSDEELDESENKEEKKKMIEEHNFEENNKKECFKNLNGDIASKYNVNKLKFINFGGTLGLTFLLGKNEYKDSFFISLLVFLRYRKLLSFEIEKKGSKDKYISIENKFLRINPFDISLGFEFGKSNIISVLFEMSLISILRNTNYTDADNYYTGRQKNKINLRDLNISIRYNKF